MCELRSPLTEKAGSATDNHNLDLIIAEEIIKMFQNCFTLFVK